MLYAYQIVLLLNLFYHNQIVLISGKVYKLPENFLIGVASSAYQIEGGHNADGKGENIWDHYLTKNPQLIKDQSNGNIACDSYHRFDDDLQILKDLNVDFYRFSISWSRILPTGYSNAINQNGIDYYNRLINGLLENDIVPIVTMYHWDLPMNLQQIGGWTNPNLANYFGDYAQILFEQFGDRVKYWITINTSMAGYGDRECPPQIDQSGIVEYLFVKTILLAHSRAYQLYKTKYRQRQNGQIGITIDGRWYESIDDQSCNREAAERMRQFTIGIYLHPLIKGDYPESLKTRIAKLSNDEHFLQSRLPPFTTNEIEMIHKSYDFIGLNMYTTYLVEDNNETVFNPNQTSFEKDINVKLSQNNDWPKSCSDWLRVEPQGLRKCLNWIKTEYDNPRIFITENGVSDDSEHEDYNRIKYIQLYLKALLEGIYEDGVNAIGYTVWSLLDNFEWLSGYTERFGLYYVDFNDPLRRRKAKLSAKWFKQLVETRQLTIADNNSHGIVDEL